MADPVALQIQSPNALTSLGQVMGIANSATQLQKSRATLEADIAQRKAESSSAETAAELAKRTLEPKVVKEQEGAKQSQIETLRKQFNLTTEQMDKIESNSDTMAQDDAVKRLSDPNTPESEIPGLVQRARDRLYEHKGFTKALGIPEHLVEQGSRIYEDALTKNPRQYGQFLLQRKVARTGPAEQVGSETPHYVQTGPTLQNVKPTATGPQTIQMAPAITQREEAATDALGNPVIKTLSNEGKVGFKPVPGSNMPPLMALPPGETKETAVPLMALRQQTNTAASSVPEQHANNQQIVKYAQSGMTGTLSDTLRKAAGIVGMDKAADTAQLNHFLALQTERLGAAAGANTDAAKAVAAQVAGTATSPEKAIIGIARVNDAYATAIEMKNKGMEAAINNPENTKSIFAARDFQNQWTQVMSDPLSLKAMQLHNAVTAKNNATTAAEQMEAQKYINEIVQSVGGKKSNGASKLAKQYLMIEKLSTDGR